MTDLRLDYARKKIERLEAENERLHAELAKWRQQYHEKDLPKLAI